MTKYKITKTDNKTIPCTTTIEVTIPADVIIAKKADAIKNIGEHINVDGFRPGHIPEKIITQKVGEIGVYEEATRNVLDEVFFEIISETKELPVNRPDILITKIALDTDAEVKITFATKPIVKLGDYKKVKKNFADKKPKDEDGKATEKEIEDMIMNLRKQVAHMQYHHNNPDDHGHNHAELEPAALDDEFAKLCGPFNNLADLNKAIVENIEQSKKQKNLEKFRIELIDAIIADSDIVYPEFILNSEIDIMIEELKGDLQRMGQSFEEYLSVVNKKVEDIRAERKDMADKRVKTQLTLSEIAHAEKIELNQEDIAKQIAEIKNVHKDAPDENIKMFVERFEMNRAVWKMLEE